MKYRKLGHTDLQVSLIGLGTMTWGEQNTEAEAHAQIDYALSRGVNLVDAAEMYPVPPKPETQGRTETYIGTWLAETRNLPRIASIQNPYNLLNRTYENGLSEFSHLEGVGLLAYSPLAMGVLAGKYLNGARPEGARMTLFTRFDRYSKPQAEQATAEYVQLAHDHGLSPASMALAFVNQQPFVTSNLMGATRLDQLKENIDSVQITLSDEVMNGIQAIHQRYPNPAP